MSIYFYGDLFDFLTNFPKKMMFFCRHPFVRKKRFLLLFTILFSAGCSLFKSEKCPAYPSIHIWSSIGCVDCTTTSNLSSLVYYSFYIKESSHDDSHFLMPIKGEKLFIDRNILGDHYHAEILSKHHNSHKEYSRVVFIEYDTIYYQMDIYKLYVAESAGIIEYVRRKGDQSVYLIDD